MCAVTHSYPAKNDDLDATANAHDAVLVVLITPLPKYLQ